MIVTEAQLAKASDMEKPALTERLDWMQSVDMAVVVSQGQNEIDDLKQKGLDILPHRERMQKEDLEAKFKDASDPLRLVFVCAMWITGFDVPTCSTVYLDKPMKNHTLMQTIARANRRAAVQSTIRFTLNDLPEEPYPDKVWEEKVDAVWAFIFSKRSQMAGDARF